MNLIGRVTNRKLDRVRCYKHNYLPVLLLFDRCAQPAFVNGAEV